MTCLLQHAEVEVEVLDVEDGGLEDGGLIIVWRRLDPVTAISCCWMVAAWQSYLECLLDFQGYYLYPRGVVSRTFWGLGPLDLLCTLCTFCTIHLL